MRIFILGICGTFMAGIAVLARALGHSVEGCDAEVFPPMSTLLQRQGIAVHDGFAARHLKPAPDLLLVGNVVSRGNPAVEYALNQGIPYMSGPEWLSREVLQRCWVLAVAGTHGKTTTASLLAWILEQAGLHPGFLIGGIAKDFDVPARLPGDNPFFVIEADEYDTAFFDKRAKFLHYRPTSLLLNNLEYDHADIYTDLAAMQRQFHHLLRTVPSTGRVFLPARDQNLEEVLAQGCWSETARLFLQEEQGREEDWCLRTLRPDGTHFMILPPRSVGDPVEVHWELCGMHNLENALGAAAMACHVGVAPATIARALSTFGGVQRRMQLRGTPGGVRVYDDFAHHPTAIRLSLEGLRARLGADARIVAVLEPRSYTMRSGVHRDTLARATAAADRVFWLCPPSLEWDMEHFLSTAKVCHKITELLRCVVDCVRDGDHVVVMSNGDFGGFHQRLLDALDPSTGD